MRFAPVQMRTWSPGSRFTNFPARTSQTPFRKQNRASNAQFQEGTLWLILSSN